MFKINNKDRKNSMAYFKQILCLFLIIILSNLNRSLFSGSELKENASAKLHIVKARPKLILFWLLEIETFIKITFVFFLFLLS